MGRRVVFGRLAIKRLDELYDYIAGASSPVIAISYLRRIRRVCLSLAEFPERGHRRDDILPGLRVMGFERRVTIAFRVSGQQVEIVTVAYGGRDFVRELGRKRRASSTTG